jgi:hypothetical protein
VRHPELCAVAVAAKRHPVLVAGQPPRSDRASKALDALGIDAQLSWEEATSRLHQLLTLGHSSVAEICADRFTGQRREPVEARPIAARRRCPIRYTAFPRRKSLRSIPDGPAQINSVFDRLRRVDDVYSDRRSSALGTAMPASRIILRFGFVAERPHLKSTPEEDRETAVGVPGASR